jgi:hypothetical protein
MAEYCIIAARILPLLDLTIVSVVLHRIAANDAIVGY